MDGLVKKSAECYQHSTELSEDTNTLQISTCIIYPKEEFVN